MNDFSLDELVSGGHISRRTKYNYVNDLERLDVNINSIDSDKRMYLDNLSFTKYHYLLCST